jgi:ketosteroid isomerase-like protein
MAQSTTSEIREAIAAANEQFMAAFRRGDAAVVAAAYSANGQVPPPHSDVIAGQ